MVLIASTTNCAVEYLEAKAFLRYASFLRKMCSLSSMRKAGAGLPSTKNCLFMHEEDAKDAPYWFVGPGAAKKKKGVYESQLVLIAVDLPYQIFLLFFTGSLK